MTSQAIGQFSIGYFGAQGRMWPYVQEFIPEGAKRYLDYTAGGFGNPLKAAVERKMPVAVNDLCQYVVIAARSVFEDPIEEAHKEYSDLMNFLDNIVPRDGMMIAMKEAGTSIAKRGAFTDELRQYVDGLCSVANNRMKFAVGKVLMDATFRGMTWCGTSANAIPILEWTTEYFKEKLLRWYRRFEVVRLTVQETGVEHKVVSYDCGMIAKIAPELHKDAVIYLDPAWPWKDATLGVENPYEFVASIISGILLQRETSTPQFRWEEMTNEEIADEATNWVQRGLGAGAMRFILNTQSTNRPSVEMLLDSLNQKGISHTVANKQSFKGTNKPFEETWIVCENGSNSKGS